MTTRLGLLYPGYAAEDDYVLASDRLGDDVEITVVHTSVGTDAHQVDALLDLGGSDRLLAGAAELANHHPDAAVWACTSGSFVFGHQGARRQVDELQVALGVPASSTSFAFVNAARALEVKRVAVAATYPDDVARRFTDFLDLAGIATLALEAEDVLTAVEVGTFDRDRALAFVTAADHADADAVLVPDTALHSLAWVDDAEVRLGKPVLSANQVTVWEALRLTGSLPRANGLGRLFAG